MQGDPKGSGLSNRSGAPCFCTAEQYCPAIRNLRYDPATVWQAYVRFRSGSTTRADVAENEDDARKALEDAMNQLKSNGIGTVGPSLVVTKDDLEFIKLEQKQQER